MSWGVWYGPLLQGAAQQQAGAAEEAIEVLIAADPNYNGWEWIEDGTIDTTAQDSGAMVSTSMDISWFFAEQLVEEAPVELLVAADVNHQNVEMFSLYPRAPPWDDDYAAALDISYIFADRNVDVVDTLDVAVTETSQVEVPPATVDEIIAAQPVFPTEDLIPSSLEEYMHVSTLDVAWFFSAPPEEEIVFTYGVRIT
jgi:hypothetical protein